MTVENVTSSTSHELPDLKVNRWGGTQKPEFSWSGFILRRILDVKDNWIVFHTHAAPLSLLMRALKEMWEDVDLICI